MRVLQVLILIVLVTSFGNTEAKGWSDYKYFSSFSGVDYYYKVKYTKTTTKIKWKVKNKNSYKVMAGFKQINYTVAGGEIIKKGGSGWYIKPYSEYSFISDTVDGRLTDINIIMQVKKE